MSEQIAVLRLETCADPVYYNVSTSRKMDQVCRAILKERLDEHMYDCGDLPTIEDIQDRQYSGSVESIARQQKAELENEMSAWRHEVSFRKRVVDYLSSDPDKLAEDKTLYCHSPSRYHPGYSLLLERSLAPDEGVELIRPREFA